MKTEAIQREIWGKTEIDFAGLEIANDLKAKLQPFLGKKVITLKGLSSKLCEVNILKSEPKPMQKGHFAKMQNSYITNEYGNLVLKLSICLNGGSYDDNTYYCQYFNKTIELGKLNGDVLESIVEKIEIPKPLNFDDEMEKIKKYKVLAEQAEQAKSAIKLPEHLYRYL